MKPAVLALASAAWLCGAPILHAAPPKPADQAKAEALQPYAPPEKPDQPQVRPDVISPYIERRARPQYGPPAPPPRELAPSEVSGYIVYKDAEGRLRPSDFYPRVEARFVLIGRVDSRGLPIVYKVSLFDAGAGLQRVSHPDGGGTIAWRYRFSLSADRLARDHYGVPGVERDPERPSAIRFNPDTLRYDGFEVTLNERWYDPNLRREAGRGATGVIRPRPYEDTVRFTR